MTVSELIELLESEDPKAEVRLMSQPSWPFEYSIRSLWLSEHQDFDPEDDEGGFEPADNDEGNVVYIVEGAQLGYGSKDAWS